MFRLNCPVQTYPWGKQGEDSLVARLKRSGTEEGKFSFDANQYYAELWMGTHPSGPAKLAESDQILASWLKDKESSVGIVPEGYPANDLPYLFKVLSIRTALSIQAHPDKTLAAQLHQRSPENYKDPNHKPEMVIALTRFECFCGFRTVPEILEHSRNIPEFGSLLQMTGVDLHKEGLTVQDIFQPYMNSSADSIHHSVQSLVERLTAATASLDTLEHLLLRLHTQYPHDIGIFAPLLLNYLILSPGESFFIGPNEPHAYVSGDCMECMALSDNVVRAGLTPKFKDVDTLCSMLTYHVGPPEFLQPLIVDQHTVTYRPPAKYCAEFEVDRTEVPVDTTYSLPAVPCGSILLVVQGSEAIMTAAGEELRVTEGATVFVAANTAIQITSQSTSTMLYRAHVNLSS